MTYLKQVKYQLPDTDKNFSQKFLSFLEPLGRKREDQILLPTSQPDFIPETIFEFTDVKIPNVLFVGDDFEHIIEIKNVTGVTKLSPHKYTPIEIEDFIKRLGSINLANIDHTGFNLPFFEGIHPEILKLREFLKNKCLYHEFPKNLADEPWDFILPGTLNEISGKEAIDYHKARKPKIEIVSFPKSSTPLIQIDIQLETEYEKLLKLFPEAIDDSGMKNLWVYIKNDFGIDVCFVLNEVQDKDWSFYFENSRLS